MKLRFPEPGGEGARVRRFLAENPALAAQIAEGGEPRGRALAVILEKTGVTAEDAAATVAAIEERSRVLRKALVPEMWTAGASTGKPSVALQVKLLASPAPWRADARPDVDPVRGHERGRVDKLKAQIASGVASCVNPAILSALIGATGTAAIFFLLAIPVSIPVVAIYFALGTSIGRFAPQIGGAVDKIGAGLRSVAARARDFARRRLGLGKATPVAGHVPGRVARLKERIAQGLGKLASPVVISALINGAGVLACSIALGVPFSLPVAATFMLLGTGVGAFAPQLLGAVHRFADQVNAVVARAREHSAQRLANAG